MRSLIAVSLLSATISASAQSADSAHLPRFPRPQTASWLSVTLTVVPAVAGAVIQANNSGNNAGSLLFSSALLIGPATGFWYGDIGGKAWPGLLLRSGGLAIAAAGAAGCLGDLFSSPHCSTGQSAALIGGSLIVLGSAIYDAATVGGKVRANNAARARALIVPLFPPSARGFGVAVVIGF